MVHDKVGKAQWITSWDTRSGYWQISVKPEHRWLTVFVTDFGLFEWVRMPFGLKCAPNSFIRALQQLLFPLRDFCDSYVDDIATFTSGRLAVALRASACIFANNAQSWPDSEIGEM